MDQFLIFNDSFLSVMGYARDEIMGHKHSIFGPGLQPQKTIGTFGSGLDQRHFTAKFQRFGKAGTEVWIQASYIPIIGEEGDVVKVVKIASDITKPRPRMPTIKANSTP